MGLKDYKKWKLENQLKESETIAALRQEIANLKAEVNMLKTRPNIIPVGTLTETQKKEIKEKRDNAAKPEDFIKMFTSDLEEFNPDA